MAPCETNEGDSLLFILIAGRFIDSIFELVDIWTETAEEQEYLDLLELLTAGITKVGQAP